MIKNSPKAPHSIRLVLNNRAANDSRLREAVKNTRAEGHEVEIRVIWEAGDAVHFASEAVVQGRDIVVAAGGDGTLNEVINGVLSKDTDKRCAVGLLPFGTANDFASGCGIPLEDPISALSLIVNSTPIPIDLGKVNDRLFINVASGGYGARVTTDAPPEAKQLFGGFAYLLSALTQVPNIAGQQTWLSAPDFEWEGLMIGLTVGNGVQAGGGFRVAPQALLNDGLLDLLVLPGLPWQELTRLVDDLLLVHPNLPWQELTGLVDELLLVRPNLPWQELTGLVDDLLKKNTDVNFEHLIYRQLPWLELTTADELQVNLDGEPLKSRHFCFEALSKRVLFCLPSSAPLSRN
ncbi:MAG: YegS/Rv2252/BmrU family lipid kinase [Xenococcaceae cyanobacterium]